MSMQPPPSELPSYGAMIPPVRPTSVTFISVMGIVFGALGCLCIVVGFAWQVASGQGQPESAAAMKAFGIVSGMAGLILSIVLLIGSIGALSLRPWARATLMGFAIVDLMYDVGKLVLTFVWIMPQMDTIIRNSPQVRDNPQMRDNPQAIQQAIKIGKAVGMGTTVATAVLTIGLALMILIIMAQPKTKAAFEGRGEPM